jgi:peptidoglycan/LPS O-acetylase OafA/YrhL
VPVALFAFTSWGVVSVARIISVNRTRRKIVDAHATPELVDALLAARPDSNLAPSLMWGLVLASTGIALMILEVLPFDQNSPFRYGVVVLGAGAGLLAYFAIARRQPEGGVPASAQPRATGRPASAETRAR